MVLFQNCVRQSRSPTKMATTVQLHCYWKQLWSRWAITGSWEPLVYQWRSTFYKSFKKWRHLRLCTPAVMLQFILSDGIHSLMRIYLLSDAMTKDATKKGSCWLSWWLVGFWCLTSLSTIFQLYRGGQFSFVEETGVPGKNHRPVASQTLWHNVVPSTPRLSGVRTHNVSWLSWSEW
jgi:hypothetical protein